MQGETEKVRRTVWNHFKIFLFPWNQNIAQLPNTYRVWISLPLSLWTILTATLHQVMEFTSQRDKNLFSCFHMIEKNQNYSYLVTFLVYEIQISLSICDIVLAFSFFNLIMYCLWKPLHCDSKVQALTVYSYTLPKRANYILLSTLTSVLLFYPLY